MLSHQKMKNSHVRLRTKICTQQHQFSKSAQTLKKLGVQAFGPSKETEETSAGELLVMIPEIC